MKAVIPAAGLGTRFLPATKAQPKEMLPVYDKPTIQYVIEESVNSGVDDILIVTGKGKRSIEDHFDRSFELEHHLKTKGKEEFLKEIEYISDLADIHFIRQKKQKGLGDAIYCAKKHVGNDPFVVMLGDTITKDTVPCTKQLIDIHEKYGKSVIALEEVPDEKVERYGIIGGEEIEPNIYQIDKLVEKPPLRVAPSNLAIMGRYVLTPDIFDCIENVEPGYGGEIQLTDALSKLDEIYGQVFKGQSYDIGNRIDWLKTSLRFALEDEKAKDEILNFIKNEII
ncbi:MAG: UTP--glucose-1-phosphate uridylyltransferase GalU [Methanobrevibacter ruminantium]|jgi:UTP--glucose-1-phosphate uridylyltransferase|uniref:UTP--glucose-1-phosphate uridylyltransferase GalU n=1 Tax=Methanobrevibacter ruminantium TaxID=83816 RepID=UPI0026EF86B0|nr:UTP--glucose-1-phosphate uridylyltransferase GalU [Methanobrevibacter ruminantium]MCI5737174.1 UTP--glucose-1-phosphate uridylyltransferase GalU [Methanobrevibacter ruminantium]MDD6049461.1 UTP--glucose-1-phosphate uridylyltransferase GalU [Methanobrevibacter ruminantium]MDO5841891.1 UTP--glucose-1-phosphate uridylyltransferase GalU [Methanobrevibacter ruminantium]